MLDNVNCLILLTDRAKETGDWLVLVVPKDPPLNTILSGLFPVIAEEGSIYSGRTIRFPNGGMVSVTEYQDKVFVPKDKEFSTMFLGLDENPKQYMADLHRWTKHSKAVLTPFQR
jgi:hypothetical protein